jgi:hypothetical protein
LPRIEDEILGKQPTPVPTGKFLASDDASWMLTGMSRHGRHSHDGATGGMSLREAHWLAKQDHLLTAHDSRPLTVNRYSLGAF